MPDKESLSILIPTLNEADNIRDVLKRTIKSLESINIAYEILVIDDASSDNTADIAEIMLGQKGRVIRRIASIKSLSFSVIDGLKQAKGDIILVMDGDGSHPPELIPLFVDSLQAGHDLVIGSRYVRGGGTENFPLVRKIISQFACLLGRVVTNVKDNTSGFFCIRKAALAGVNLIPFGFKIGLEIFVKAKVYDFKEIPYIFANRRKGESKLKIKITLQYLYQILSLLNYRLSAFRNAKNF